MGNEISELLEQLESSYLVAVTKGRQFDISFSNDSFLVSNDMDDEIKNLFDSVEIEPSNPIDMIF